MVQRARSRLGVNPQTIGFLADLLEDGYQSAIAGGVLKGAKNGGANVLCFVGGVLGSPLRSALQRNHVFELASPATVDGLVLLGGTLVNHVGPDALAKFCERYRPLPICSVGMELPGIASVLIDNEVGMRNVVEHLIVAHQFKRIAFVRGPLANAEAELRFNVYRAVMDQHGIAFNERLVVVGNFQSDSGRAAVACLFDERKFKVDDIDAIVVSNDNMAFGVIAALSERGLRVPQDVAVTGFDDVEEARYVNPGLTTVRQPLEEQGREAVRIVLMAAQHQQRPESLRLRTSLVVRGSCGCSGPIEHQSVSTRAGLFLGFEATLVSRRQHMLAELARSARGSMTHAGANWEGRLVATVSDALHGKGTVETTKLFEVFVQGLLDRGLDVAICHDLLDCLRHEILECLHKEPERRTLAEDLFQDIRLVIGRSAERHLGASRLKVQHWSRQLSIVGTRLIGSFDLIGLRDAVTSEFPSLAIASCFIVMYEGDTGPAPLSKLILAYDHGTEASSPTDSQFATKELLPPNALNGTQELRDFVVAPLFFEKQILGYLVIEFEIAQAFAYEAIRELISAALKGAMLVQHVRQQKDELNSALSIISDNETRQLTYRSRMEQLAKDLATGTVTDIGEVRAQLDALLSSL
jgi:DNA-binding LacI/PurR family transcriptional regulator